MKPITRLIMVRPEKIAEDRRTLEPARGCSGRGAAEVACFEVLGGTVINRLCYHHPKPVKAL
jgi:hypothetical protein